MPNDRRELINASLIYQYIYIKVMNKFVTSRIFSPNYGVAGDVKAPQKVYSSTTNQGKEHSSS